MIIDGMDKFSLAENKERKGFFFLANANSSADAVNRLCETLIRCEITRSFPETVYLGDKGLSVFVYGDDFHGPSFFQRATIVEQMAVCRVGTIAELEQLPHPDLKA